MEATGELNVLDRTGDTKIVWDKNNEAEVEVARDAFNALKTKGYLAYSVKKDGEKNVQIHEFDPEAEKLIMVPKIVGG